MRENLIKFIEEKCPGAKPILIVIRGSHAYGTNIETSDTDYAGIYIQSIDDILGFGYKEQISDEKNDTVFYEIKRFLELVKVNNPNILELLSTPEDCIIYKDPSFDEILKHKNEFITKFCSKSFAGYAMNQIKKAKGQDKFQNWDSERIERKTPLDFCYLHKGENSLPLNTYLGKYLDQRFCGLSKLPHSRDSYALFYDYSDDKSLGFRGISFEDSNDIRLSSIPFDCPKDYFIGHISYNKDGYSSHCNEYHDYQTWLKNKNDQRWIDVKGHGQKIDGKNMMHCRRLLEMAKEIGEGKGINIRRPNAEYLISIRRGEIDLQTLIDTSKEYIDQIDEIFKSSILPESVDNELISNLLTNIRKQNYNL